MSTHSRRHLRAYERRIVYSLLGALLAIQLVAYTISSQTNRRIAENTVRAHLATGGQVFYQLLELRQHQLEQAASVLAADYGLKDAVAIGERPTLESMLGNHAKRIQADVAILRDLDKRVIASVPDSLQTEGLGERLSSASHFAPSAGPGHIATLTDNQRLLYQLVSAPVNMPRPLAELTLGFAIDSAFARSLRQVADSEFTFVSRGPDGQWQLHGSSLLDGIEPLLAARPALEESGIWTLDGEHGTHLMLSLPLQPGRSSTLPVMVIMGESLNQALAPYHSIERIQRYLILASLLLSTLMVLFTTRRLVSPLNALAHLDPLTGLANRRLFDRCLDQAQEELLRKGTPFGVMVIDLNRFKQINDQYGHAAGDEALKVSARRLREHLRKSDIPARIGGDEFAVLLSGIEQDGLQHIAHKLEQALGEPIPFAQQTLRISISIGFAIAPQDGSDTDDLLRAADAAMYADKATTLPDSES
ncbi:diguanylate cyclase domain-containing protein [Pseudomonas sp.]|uniref:GGDEF domain-containing protein n=1 Tax=Pseudomonas sp. TaxID=306 RepID=UPI003D0D394F